jgi:two-component system LytT family response regulator
MRAFFVVGVCHFAVIGVGYTLVLGASEEGCSLKVVIIDDEKAMHLIMKRMLAKLDEIEIVGSFQETTAAFSYLANHEVDLIFLDISMPKENGLEFAKRLRESGRRMKLVFVTSYKEYAQAAFEVNAYDYIVKPVEQDRLHKTVQRVLSEKL